MSRKLAVSLLMVLLGLASWDVLNSDAKVDQVRATHDGAGSYPPR